MPVLAVKAASMSSSAFFIEAAANTVSLLFCASAGELADPHRMTRAANSPARRCIVALHAGSRARFARTNQALGWYGCDRRKRRSAGPWDLRSIGISRAKTIAGSGFG